MKKTITKTKTTTKPKPKARVLSLPKKRRRLRSSFKPRYDQIIAFSGVSIDYVVQQMNDWLKEFSKSEKHSRCFAQIMPIYQSQGSNKFIGQIIYSVEIGKN